MTRASLKHELLVGSGGMPPPEKFRFLHTLRLILKPSLSQIYTPEKRVLTEWKFHLVIT